MFQRHSLRVSRLWLLAWAGVAAFYFLTLAAQTSGGDDSVYLILAKALATGQGFSRLDIAGNPPEPQYPPGWPLLLSGVAFLFPDVVNHLIAFQAVTALCSILAFPVACWLLRRNSSVPDGVLIFLVSLAFLNPYMLFVSCQQTLSEPSYILFSFLSILLLEHAVDQARPWGWMALALLTGIASYYIRVVGLTVLFSTVVYLCWKRRWLAAMLYGAGAALLLSPWAYRNLTLGLSPLGGAYGDIFTWKDYTALDANPIRSIEDIVGRIVNNAQVHILRSNPGLFLPALRGPNIAGFLQGAGLTWIGPAFGLFLAAAILIGFLNQVRKGIKLTEIYVVVYLGFILLAPWAIWRNVLPVLPILLVYAYQGLDVVRRAIKRRWPRWGAALRVVPLAIFLPMLISVLASDRHMLYDAYLYRAGDHAVLRPTDRGFLPTADWIIQHTEPDDIVFYMSPEKIYLYTGRRTAQGLPAMPKPAIFFPVEEVFARVLEKADYLITLPGGDPAAPYTDEMHAALDRAAAAHPDRLKLVFQSPGEFTFNVYRIYRFTTNITGEGP